MKKSKEIQLNFEIDKITNSIENAISGEVLARILVKFQKQGKLKNQIGFLNGIQKLNPIRKLFIV